MYYEDEEYLQLDVAWYHTTAKQHRNDNHVCDTVSPTEVGTCQRICKCGTHKHIDKSTNCCYKQRVCKTSKNRTIFYNVRICIGRKYCREQEEGLFSQLRLCREGTSQYI